MPFKSKAQQRLFFAVNPRKAKQWADETKSIKALPEKKHPQVNPKRHKLNVKISSEQTMSDGRFFDKRAKARGGRFFRDMPGRQDGMFQKEAVYSYAPGQIPSGAGANVSPMGSAYGTGSGDTSAKPGQTKVQAGMTGMPMGGEGFRGEGMGGGMYGAGKGEKSEKDKKPGEDEGALQKLLAQAEPGKEKNASIRPTDWNNVEAGLPTGFHRPAYEQPEAVEPGGERFHSTEAKGPEYGSGVGFTTGLVGGRMKMKPTSSPQMGKAAAAVPVRFLGTSYGLEKQAKMTYSEMQDYLKARGSEYRKSLGEAGEKGVSLADKAAKNIAGSPAAALIGTALAARMGLRGAKGIGRLGAKGLRKLKRKPPPPPALSERIGAGARKLMGKITGD